MKVSPVPVPLIELAPGGVSDPCVVVTKTRYNRSLSNVFDANWYDDRSTLSCIESRTVTAIAMRNYRLSANAWEYVIEKLPDEAVTVPPKSTKCIRMSVAALPVSL